MSQLILPLIPYGNTQINNILSVCREEEGKRWIYYLGGFPIFSHQEKDLRMFRLIAAMFIDQGTCRQAEVIKAFGVSKSSVGRSVKKLRDEGPDAFFEQRRGRRGGSVLTQEVLARAQEFLDEGKTRSETADELDVRYDTLRKAIKDKRLREPARAREVAVAKSSRDRVDAAAAEGMGTACIRVEERVLASFGVFDGAPARFEKCLDVPRGGALCALPALLTNGLLEGAEKFLGKVKGYYTMFQVLLLLAFMALCRIRTAERLRGYAPGEFGKLLGLDRIPEVRCLRKKMDDLCAENAAELWAVHLGRHWLGFDNEAVGALYVDGHVRVYHGRLTKLPRRYVSRERLCLRGTTDYWVNDALGRPFFVVDKVIDPGLLNTLRKDVVPRLLADIPKQPSEQELAANPYLCRFILVFDREGYSPVFFREMWKNHRIACITYHKHPGQPWPEEWFAEIETTMPNGERITMPLAERGSLVGSGKNALWMREVRKLTDSGHQTSLISTAFELSHTQLAARMFSRWCQENFFRYMMQHFSIDLLTEYGVEDFSGAETVVNPAWRKLDKQRNSTQNKLRYARSRFAEKVMHPQAQDDPKKYEKWLNQQASLFEQIEQYERQLEEVKAKLKQTKKHIAWSELEDADQFQRLPQGRKRLMDTVRMIAYRAETAMAGLLRGPTIDSAAARRLLQDLFITEADILPEPEHDLLRVRVHSASRPAANVALYQLFDHLNAAEVQFPGTQLRMVYELASGGYPAQSNSDGLISFSGG